MALGDVNAVAVAVSLSPPPIDKEFKSWGLQMAQQLRGLAALAEDSGSVPGTYMMSHNCLLTPSPGYLVTSSVFSGHCTHMVHIHTCMHIHIFRQNTH